MKHAMAFVLLLIASLVLVVACSSPTPTPTAAPTPTPAPAPTATPQPTATPTTPAPTPTPDPIPEGFAPYMSLEQGVSLHYPRQWSITQTGGEGAWLVIEDEAQVSRLLLLPSYSTKDVSLNERMETILTELTPEDSDARIVRGSPVTLPDGSQAARADIIITEEGGETVQRVQLSQRGRFNYTLQIIAPASEIERHEETLETMLTSFESFPPSPYGIPRDRAFTMGFDDPSTLDPALSGDVTSHFYVASLFRGLVHIDADLEIVPDLAEGWEVDDAGVVYTFTLRDGITFHDGRPITADDFKYSIERAADPELHSETAPRYFGDIVGISEKIDGSAEEISGVEVVDERTIRITIDEPKEYFLSKFAYPTSAVVDRNTVEPLGFDWWMSDDINGSGPYQLQQWEEDEAIILKRFDDFHDPAALEYIISPLVGLPIVNRLGAYLAGAWDGVYVGSSWLHLVDEDLSDELHEYDQLGTYYVGVDGSKPPFDDPKVRLAFLMALDRERFAEAEFDGDVEIAKGLLPPGMPGYSESLQGIPYDPEAARQLLAESRYADDFPETVFTGVDWGDGEPTDTVKFMIDAWREELGVEVQVELFELDLFFYSLEDIVGNLWFSGWVADYPDPENFLDVLLSSHTFEDRYVNDEFDSLIDQARTERDRATRLRLYAEAEQLMIEEAGLFPLFHVNDYALINPRVQGFHISPLAQPILNQVTLSPLQ